MSNANDRIAALKAGIACAKNDLAGLADYVGDVEALIVEAEDKGYARGVEDAAKIVETVHECDMGGYHWLATKVRALLKPKGEAK